jgi:hypothetical protein
MSDTNPLHNRPGMPGRDDPPRPDSAEQVSGRLDSTRGRDGGEGDEPSLQKDAQADRYSRERHREYKGK